jgi:hypothetical protein
MADVTGPIHTLPGAAYGVPDGTVCDDHPDRPATHRVQGETDSFGSEMNDLCAECYAELRAEMNAPQEAYPCDYCKVPSTDRRAIRDPDEGMYGPVYYACAPCRLEQRKRIQEEASEFEDYDYDRDDSE